MLQAHKIQQSFLIMMLQEMDLGQTERALPIVVDG
jgi:hypothetical protein